MKKTNAKRVRSVEMRGKIYKNADEFEKMQAGEN
jgi:hypothetical protein